MNTWESRREIIIMVDDDVINLTVARNNLIGKYDVVTVPSGKKLFGILERVTPDLILLDIEMPDMDGYEAIKKLKSTGKTAHIPVIFLTAKIDPHDEVMGLNLGAVDYITKPFSKELLIKRIELHILLEKQKKELMKYSLNLESEVDKKSRTVIELQVAILKTVAELVESRDKITGGHIERTQMYLRMLVEYMLEHGVYTEELLTWDIDLFILSSQLHDVGKISIKDDILMKPGVLTGEEFEEMKKHAEFGVNIIRKIEENTTENAFLQYAEVMAGSHHEKWNGTGYPYGRKGYEIPLMGRLMAIVDVYDALTNDRPYKKAFSHEKAVEIIREGLGTHFDPLIAEIFIKHEKEFGNIPPEIQTMAWDDQLQSTHKISSTIKMVANVVGFRGGKESVLTERIRRYLEIFIFALLRYERYKPEVSSWDISLFLVSSQLHDVGKLAVAENILYKTDKLTDDELEDVKIHTDYGVKIIQQIKEHSSNSSLLYHAETLAGSHHERWDGTGYPQGLKGEDIPLQGRLMAIIDVYDALTTDRPHRRMLPHKAAVAIIRNGSGTHFDPNLVKIFLECENEFNEVFP